MTSPAASPPPAASSSAPTPRWANTTFREHLTRVRMDRAAEMLARRSVTVREVAHRVGYRQPAQFAKAFRRHLGVAPSDYRANGSGHRADGAEQRLAA